MREPSRIPEAEASEEGVLVVAAPASLRELGKFVRPAASDHHFVGFEGGREPLHRLEHRLAPRLLAVLRERSFADVVLEGLLAEGEVTEFERLDGSIRDEG